LCIPARKDAEGNKNLSEQDRREFQLLAQFLQDRLIYKQDVKLERSHKTNLSNPANLVKILRLRMPVYLRAENGEAIRALQSAANVLKLPLYRFACSPRTKGTDLYPTALRGVFANGGILCIETVEKASSNFQFWLKGWLNDALMGQMLGLEKHRDFTIVLTSPTPVRQLWSGQIDVAFLDRLAYLDITNGGPSSTVSTRST